mmetsp:Transcript_33243/g.105993  ORF Transcript_33243/g.105993 Transcript_33243/m.105993 type:complete len:247 (-) Transcript_33243:2163-2903(-)
MRPRLRPLPSESIEAVDAPAWDPMDLRRPGEPAWECENSSRRSTRASSCCSSCCINALLTRPATASLLRGELSEARRSAILPSAFSRIVADLVMLIARGPTTDDVRAMVRWTAALPDEVENRAVGFDLLPTLRPPVLEFGVDAWASSPPSSLSRWMRAFLLSSSRFCAVARNSSRIPGNCPTAFSKSTLVSLYTSLISRACTLAVRRVPRSSAISPKNEVADTTAYTVLRSLDSTCTVPFCRKYIS